MNDYERAGQSAGISGGHINRQPLAQTAQQPPVHAAQDSLDKAIAQLWSEVNDIRSALRPVLTMEPEGVNKEAPPQPVPTSVSLRIGESAGAVAAAAGALRALRSRLEV